MTIRIRTIYAALALFALAGCEGESADLIREIDAAREGCTQEKLRAGDEECVRMFETYAGMGTEAIHTYIGAVKALDEALQRMPPPQFDTAGLGHAVTPQRSGELPSAGFLAPAPSRQPVRQGPYKYDESGPLEPWRSPADQPGRWQDPRSSRRPRDRNDQWDRREPRGAWDPRRGPQGQESWRGGYPAPYDDAYGGRADYPSGYGPDDSELYGDPGGWPDPRELDGRGGTGYPPERGLLRPPNERLDRPWLREEEPRRPRRSGAYPPRYDRIR